MRATDGALVEAALRDANAYAAIVRQYEGALTRYVRRLLGRHSQAAADVLQDSFIKAYLNLNDFDRSRPLEPWLYRIAHNEAVNYLRKRNAEPQVINGADGELILNRVAAKGDSSAGRQPAEVLGAVAALDARYRDVLVLRYLEDKSYDEISDILRLPPGTVATRVRRGLSRLRAALGGDAAVGLEGQLP